MDKTGPVFRRAQKGLAQHGCRLCCGQSPPSLGQPFAILRIAIGPWAPPLYLSPTLLRRATHTLIGQSPMGGMR